MISSTQKSRDVSVAVLGNGVSGLSAAWALTKAGFQVTVYGEGVDGGLIQSEVTPAGYCLEFGPNIFIEREEFKGLLGDIGLLESVQYPVVPQYKQHVWYRGEPHQAPRSPWRFLTCPMISFWKRISFVRRILFGKAPVVSGDISVGEVAKQFLGERAVRSLVEPAFRGVYGGNVADLSYAFLFQELAKGGKEGLLFRDAMRRRPKFGSILRMKGGNHTLITRLKAALTERGCTFSSKAARLEQQARSWIVSDGTAGSGRRFDGVVSTLCVEELRKIFPQLAAPTHQQEYVALTVVHLSCDVLPKWAQQSFGILFPEGVVDPVFGVMFNSNLFPEVAPKGKHLMTVILGPGAQQLSNLEKFLREGVLRKIGCSGATLVDSPRGVQYWPRAIPRYPVGHAAWAESAAKAEDAHLGLFLCGRDIGKPGVSDRINDCLKTVLRVERFFNDAGTEHISTAA